ncbi:MAG: hypothetical protein Q8O30_08890 [Candidatus Omnitrophota bacterium]|nr:hypothetical protein [Candidatus Omnitrophota bacterium]
MKKSIFLIILISLICGCVPVLIGTGLVVGYTLSSDSAIGEIKTEYRSLWDMSIKTIKEMKAENLNANESKGLIQVKISEHDITIKINQITEQVQKLKVSARKYLLPKPYFAQKIFVKIVEELK